MQLSSSSQIQNFDKIADEAKKLLIINCLDDEICWCCNTILQSNVHELIWKQKIEELMERLKSEYKIFNYRVMLQYNGITVQYLKHPTGSEITVLDFEIKK